jgi:hypothetical protein
VCEKTLIVGEFLQRFEQLGIVLAGTAQRRSAELEHIGAGAFAIEGRDQTGKDVGCLVGANTRPVSVRAFGITGCNDNGGFFSPRQDIVESVI